MYSDLSSDPCNGEKIERVALGLLGEANSVRGRGVSSSVKGADQWGTASLNVNAIWLKPCVWRKHLTPDKSVRGRAVTQGGTAAFPGRVMITLCFHKLVGEEAGGSKRLVGAAHGAETTGRLYLEVPTQAPGAGGEAALPWDGATAGCLAPRSCRKRSTFLKGPSGFAGP